MRFETVQTRCSITPPGGLNCPDVRIPPALVFKQRWRVAAYQVSSHFSLPAE
jgi:hypothetical protein